MTDIAKRILELEAEYKNGGRGFGVVLELAALAPQAAREIQRLREENSRLESHVNAAVKMLAEAEKIVPGLIQTVGRFALTPTEAQQEPKESPR